MECDVVKSSILTGQGGGTVGVVNAGVGADQSFGSAFERSNRARLNIQQVDALLPLDQQAPTVGQKYQCRRLLQTGGDYLGPEPEQLAFKYLLRRRAKCPQRDEPNANPKPESLNCHLSPGIERPKRVLRG
jgi:hypothetical protein